VQDDRLARTRHLEDWFGFFNQVGHAPLVDADTRILLDPRLTLEEAPEALRYLAAGHAKGKVILAAEVLSV
jgi:hypothetical protein